MNPPDSLGCSWAADWPGAAARAVIRGCRPCAGRDASPRTGERLAARTAHGAERTSLICGAATLATCIVRAWPIEHIPTIVDPRAVTLYATLF